MTIRPLPWCPACGDPRLVALGVGATDPSETPWVRFACGHRIRIVDKDGRILAAAAGSFERERAKQRHPSVRGRGRDPGSET